MKKFLLLVTMSTVVAGSVWAQTAAPAAPATPAAPAAMKAAAPAAAAAPTAKVNAVCKDGTPFSGDSLHGACRGHGGVDKKASKTTTAAPKPTTAAAKADGTPTVQAAGGGAGKVWANDTSKVYHCQGDKYYGKTKQGEYMSEADAKAKGFHGDHGKACS